MPEPLDDHVRSSMRSQRTVGTEAEMRVRRALHARGFRYRVDYRPDPTVRTRPDIVFTKQRIVIYIDGCFWHGCPEHFMPPKNNAEWWSDKIDRNRSRDKEARLRLIGRGWTVLSFWEHQEPGNVSIQIAEVVRQAVS